MKFGPGRNKKIDNISKNYGRKPKYEGGNKYIG